MKILLLITGLGVGGAENVVVNLGDRLAGEGHRVKIVYLTGPVLMAPKNKSVQVIGLGMKSWIGIFSAFTRLRTLVLSFEPNIVHSHMVHANILARLVKLAAPNFRLVCTAHSSFEGGWFRMFAYRLTDRIPFISTNVSNEAVSAFLRAKASRPGRMITVHNGVCTSRYRFDPLARTSTREDLGLYETNCLILAVGRMHAAKDYPNLLRAFAIVHASHPACILGIAGDGPLRREIELLASELNLLPHVKFLGIRGDIPALMSAADIFVLPSAWEGFGMVVAEAMACERTVVATDSGGVREVVGNVGYLTQPRDCIGLANSLKLALSLSAEERTQLGLRARQRVLERYSLDAAIQRWLRLYSGNLGCAI